MSFRKTFSERVSNANYEESDNRAADFSELQEDEKIKIHDSPHKGTIDGRGNVPTKKAAEPKQGNDILAEAFEKFGIKLDFSAQPAAKNLNQSFILGSSQQDDAGSKLKNIKEKMPNLSYLLSKKLYLPSALFE